MNKLYYPAVFQKEETGYSVWLNDVSGCISQGDTFEEAVENIKDALGLCLEAAADEHTELPEPSAPDSIELEPEQFVVIIEFDKLAYLKKHDKRAIKKTLSIPAWLNVAAEEQHINFSAVLQAALKEKLHING